MTRARRPHLTVADHVRGVRAGDRAVLARTITLIESSHPRHRAMAAQVLTALAPFTGGALRVGLTGVPGVGKSTFVESLGLQLVESGHRLAVLAVDPSSAVSGGSILGDKTRMQRLAADPRAFIRPSPSQGTLGGVHRRTRETLLLCEAAGYDVVLVETVGVGQSEASVANMVDTFVVLVLAGAGDELQGIKKGVLELADVLAVNKADGPNVVAAKRRARELERALHLVRQRRSWWTPPVLSCSSIEGDGLADVWQSVLAHRSELDSRGELDVERARQRRAWMWARITEALREQFEAHPGVARCLPEVEAELTAGTLSAAEASERLLARFSGDADA
ncbi:MAG: methylmalonyl Co-A mutase-associated GTPase MeaB [Myxococcota bacterium]